MSFDTRLKERLLTEALEKRIQILARETMKEFFNIFAEEFARYGIHKIPGFHPAIMHFNESFLFMQFIESLLYSYKMVTHQSMMKTRDMMSDPAEIIKLLSDPEFLKHVREFKERIEWK